MGRLAPRSGKGEERAALDVIPLLQQKEEQFGYQVMARALDRSADANRFLDTLLFTLMATQAAIYAIILDKIHEYSRTGWEVLLGGLVAAVVGASLTVFVHDGPDPKSFWADFPDQPEQVRREHADAFVSKAEANERLRAIKTLILALAVVMTVASLLIATAWRAGTL
jgi:hypothetical protein